MSDPAPENAICAALETALVAVDGVTKAATAWENTAFTPPNVDVPYQEATFVWAQPFNAEYGAGFQQSGYMQVLLRFPGGKGRGPALAQARKLRDAFKRGTSLTSGGVVTTINQTPQILPGFTDDKGRYAVAVRIPFFAQLQS